MADEAQPLTDEERAELEALRAEKAARERAELEELRAQKNASAHKASAQTPTSQRPAPQAPAAQATAARRSAEDLAAERRIAEQRERGARLMEPDDDLRMPLGQKIVLGVIALAAVLIAAMTFFIH